MKTILSILIALSILPFYAFDRSQNPKLFDEVLQERHSDYSQFAQGASGNGGSSGGDEGGGDEGGGDEGGGDAGAIDYSNPISTTDPNLSLFATISTYTSTDGLHTLSHIGAEGENIFQFEFAGDRWAPACNWAIQVPDDWTRTINNGSLTEFTDPTGQYRLRMGSFNSMFNGTIVDWNILDNGNNNIMVASPSDYSAWSNYIPVLAVNGTPVSE